mgnify:FL=1|tara:strand:- start:136 stop:369 length:234 start_codon:yes stop_codon:yes gene_type:complete
MVRKMTSERLKQEGRELIKQLGEMAEIIDDMKKIVYEFVGEEDVSLEELRSLLLGFDARISNIEGAFANIFRSARDS